MEFAFIKSSQKGVGFFLLDQGTNYPKPPVIVTTNEYFEFRRAIFNNVLFT